MFGLNKYPLSIPRSEFAVHLPTENLDKSKKYYVTFTINRRGNGSIDDEEDQPPELQYTQSIDNHVIPQVSES